MAKVIVGTTMSLDGFINDRHGEVGRLYPDLAALRQTEWLQEEMRTTGAVVMGRHAYDMAQGDLTGYEFQVPIFVVTHQAPDQAHKEAAVQFLQAVIAGRIDEAYEQYVDMRGQHHNPYFAAGFAALQAGMRENHVQFPHKTLSVKHVLGEGDLVAVHSHLVLSA